MKTSMLKYLTLAAALGFGALNPRQTAAQPLCLTPPPGMVLWLPLDEPTGPTAQNLAGGNNGTHVGNVTPGTSGYVDKSVTFPGINNNPTDLDHVEVPSYPAIEFATGDFSFDAWIRPNNPQRVETILSKFNKVTQQGYAFFVYPGSASIHSLGVRLGGGGSAQLDENLGCSVQIGVWSHVAVTVRRGVPNGVVCYVNGQAGTQPVTAPPGSYANANPLWLGEDEASVNPVPSEPVLTDMRGEIDEVELFNRALTPAEVMALFNAGSVGKCKPRCIPPPAKQFMALWLPLDETSGTTATNFAKVSGVLNGTHINGPTFNPNSFAANSLCFDGVDDQVQVQQYQAIQFGIDDFSVDAWVKVGLDNSFRTIVEHREVGNIGGSPTVRGYSLFLWDNTFGNINKIGFQMGDGGFNWQNFTSSLTVPADGRWHLVAVTVERNSPTGIKFYLDGNVDTVVTPTPYLGNVTPPANNPLIVGASAFASSFFKGCIDEVELFRSTLTAAEVQALYNAGSAGKCKPVCPPPANANMVLWLPLDENGLTAKNLAGGNNGTHVNGPTHNSGSFVLNSRCFDGVDDQVQVVSYPAIEFGTNDFSVDAWVKLDPADPATSIRTIVEHRQVDIGNNEVIGYNFTLWFGNTLAFQMGNAGNANWVNFNSTLPPVPNDGQWHLVAVTVNRSSNMGITFYVDGVADPVKQDPTPYFNSVTPPPGNPLIIGASAFVSSFFKGCIDEVELFNRELSAAEVKALWKAGSAGKCKPVCTPKPANNVLWLPLDEPTGPTAYNLTAYYLPGILNGTHIGGPTPNPNSFVFNSLCFDGVNDVVKVPSYPALGFGPAANPAPGGGNFSVDAWVKVDPGNFSIRTIVEHRDLVGGIPKGYSLFLWPGPGNNIGFQIGDGALWSNFDSGLPVPADGLWHFVAVTVNRSSASGITFYLDKLPPQYDSPMPYSGSVTPSSNNPLIVGGSAFVSSFFKGCIDEVELFNRELTPVEVMALCAARSAGKCKPNPNPIPFPIMDPPQLTGNTLTLRWSNVTPGQSVEVEATTNFIDWTVVASPPEGTNEVELPVNPGQPARFFRLRGPSEP